MKTMELSGADLLAEINELRARLTAAESRREEAQQACRNLYENLRDACVEVSMQGTIISFNSAFSKMLGYTAEDIRSLRYEEITPADWHDFEERITREQILVRGFSDVYEKKCRRKDGTLIPVEIQTVLQRDDLGNPKAMWASIRDVTQHKIAEQELHVSSEAFRTLAENSPNLVVRFDASCKHLYVNSAGAMVAGVPAARLIGKSIAEIGLPESQTTIWEERIRQVISTGQLMEIEDTMPGGKYFQYRIAPEMAPDGTIETAIVVGSDITEIKHKEEALRKKKMLLKIAQKLAHLGTWTRDMQTDQLEWSEETCDIFGVPVDTVPTFFDFARFVHPDDEPLIREGVARGLARKQQISIQYRITRSDGALRYLAERFNPVYDQDGNLLKLEGCVQDITEMKQAEVGLQEANQDLEKKVLKRTEELREKDHFLIQKSRMATMGEMISFIAHQWRQPLNNLGLLAQQMKILSEFGIFGQEDINKNVFKSMEIIHHMSKTIDDFTNFCRPDKTKTAFNVAGVVRKTVNLLEASLTNRNVKVQINAHEPDRLVFGYENEYGQALLVLLQNARDVFSERKTDEPCISISVGWENCHSVVTVADNAGGVPDAIMDKIFDPYFSTKAPAHGSGLGLFMSKIIIEKNMNGRITVRNTEDGAEFRIEIPVDPASAAG